MKQGRPKSSGPIASETVTLRLTPDQKAQLAAQLAGHNSETGQKLSVSAFLSSMIEKEQKAKKVSMVEQTYDHNPLWMLLPKEETIVHGKSIISQVDNKEEEVFFISVVEKGFVSNDSILCCNGNEIRIKKMKNEIIKNTLSVLGDKLSSNIYEELDKIILEPLAEVGRNFSMYENLITGDVKVNQMGGRTTHVFMPFTEYAKFLKAENPKVMVEITSEGGVPVSGIEIILPSGYVYVLPDRHCPQDMVYGLDLDTWKYLHVGSDPVAEWNLDGVNFINKTEDGTEHRFFSYGALVCSKPGRNFATIVNV